MSDSFAIDDLSALQAIIGKTPPAIALKVIDHLDASALHWISQSPLLFAGFGAGAGIAITLAGGERGFAAGDAQHLRIPLARIDQPEFARPGVPFCSLFLAPGIGETLRVNGRVAAVEADAAVIAVEECYVHCAKALIRSDFWFAQPIDEAPDTLAAFIAGTRFMALATTDRHGRADLSPKGDPAGLMTQGDSALIRYADRPGNRRVDSFRNIIDQPNIAAALLIPGTAGIVRFRGRARISAAPSVLAPFAVKDKVPLLVTSVEVDECLMETSPALERARIWPLAHKAEAIDPAKMFVAHVKLNKDKGITARLAGSVMSIPGLMQKGLDKDYKTNLY